MSDEPQTAHGVKHSDQLPEEAPAEQVVNDVPDADEGGAREAARKHAHDVAGPPGSRRSGPGSPEEAPRRASEAQHGAG
jgi:hypothetical protein